MKGLLWRIGCLLVLTLLPLLSAAAQEAERVTTQTGRLSLELPAGWAWRFLPQEEELRGIDSETLVLGTSDAAIDGYLNLSGFNGTVIFLSAYPYSVYNPSVLGYPAAMLGDVTVYAPEDISLSTLAGYPAAEFLYLDDNGGIFIWEVLFDTGELSYRATAYSTRLDDYETVQALINSASFASPPSADLFISSQSSRTVQTDDTRLQFAIPDRWLYWVESENTLSFASSGAGYEGISYAFYPQANREVVFVVQRMMKSALRGGELNASRQADLPAIAQRLRRENGGLSTDKLGTVQVWQSIPRYDLAWLVQGSSETMQARTVLLDGGDVVYFIQAQYAAANAALLEPIINTIFASMSYQAPATLMDVSVIGLEPGQTAPDFSLPLLDGGETNLAAHRGQVVLMNMWASWCGPCHREAPHMESLYQDYSGAFEILAVNVGETAYEAGGFARRYSLSFPVLLDSQEQVARLYDLTAYPTTYIIGRDGVILEKIRGSFSEQGLIDLLALYVGQPAGDT